MSQVCHSREWAKFQHTSDLKSWQPVNESRISPLFLVEPPSHKSSSNLNRLHRVTTQTQTQTYWS